jgi:hypothetical protein
MSVSGHDDRKVGGIPLKASVCPSATPRTAPCSVQATSGPSDAQVGGCAAVVTENRTAAPIAMKTRRIDMTKLPAPDLTLHPSSHAFIIAPRR